MPSRPVRARAEACRRLDRPDAIDAQDEIEGVLAHEVAHIANGDMVTMTLLQGVMNAFVMFFARVIAHALTRSGDSRNNNGSYYLIVIVLQVVLGILGSLVVNWFSRYREFRADMAARRWPAASE